MRDELDELIERDSPTGFCKPGNLRFEISFCNAEWVSEGVAEAVICEDANPSNV